MKSAIISLAGSNYNQIYILSVLLKSAAELPDLEFYISWVKRPTNSEATSQHDFNTVNWDVHVSALFTDFAVNI